MKKLLILSLTLALLCSMLPMAVSAAPAAPTVQSSVKDCTYSVYTSHDVTLTARFNAPENGELEYQWYVADTEDEAALTPIPGATEKTYGPTQEVGVKYYCVAAWIVDGEEKSEATYDRMARVEFTPSTVKVDSMSLAKLPNKTLYYIGETLDLTGMHVVVSSGYDIYDSYDGSGIIYTSRTFTKTGEYTISFTYGNGSVKDSFTVTVVQQEATHTHEFGEWNTISEPNCGINGYRFRRCDCGEDETEILPATGLHAWEEVSKENGVTTYRCPDCAEEKTEGTPITTDSPAATTPQNDNNNTPSKKDGRFPWWILMILVIALLIGGIVLYLHLLEKNRQKKKAARKRPKLPE